MNVEKSTDELRIALSMRGGVSLAVWIGGAVEELDRLTRADTDGFDLAQQIGPPDFYKTLLQIGGYRRAALDVITGASAGGLNGVVLAASRVYGFDFSEMLRIWVELADIELLTRDPVNSDTDHREPGKRHRQPPSLLKGNEYFLDQLRTQLRKLIDKGSSEKVVKDPFDLILSTTLVNPAYENRDDDPFSPITELRRSAHFHFRFIGETGDNGGDFQSIEEAVRSNDPGSTAALLALAGRATSSFPIAFEAAIVDHAARRVFSDPPAEGDIVQVLDGGVLDNIPVTKAIEAIAAAPVPSDADRWLVFLHPSPTVKAASERLQTLNASPRALKMLLTTTSAAFGQESLLDDLEELERHNDEAERQRIRRDAAIGAIWRALPASARKAGGASYEELAKALDTLTRYYEPDCINVRSRLDAARVVDVLEGKIRVRRPLADGPDRVGRGDWLRQVHGCLDDDVAAGYAKAYQGQQDRHLAVDGDVLASVGGLLLAGDLLATWIRGITVPRRDHREQPRPPADLVRDRGRLHALALQLGELRRVVTAAANWSDQVWLVAAHTGPQPGCAWADEAAVLSVGLLRRAPSSEFADLRRAWDAYRADPRCGAADLSTRLAALDDRVREYIRAGVLPPVDATTANEDGRNEPADGPVDLAAWIWGELVQIMREADRLGDTSGMTMTEDRAGKRRSRETTIAPATEVLVPRGVLLSDRAAPASPTRAPADGPNRAASPRPRDGASVALALAAAESNRTDSHAPCSSTLGALVTLLTPLQASALQSSEQVRFLRIAGSNSTPLEGLLKRADKQSFDVADKLCGNELGNFAAFFSARWRVNDWMWGRLDAVKSIVDLLVRSERIHRSALSADEIIRAVQTIAIGAGMAPIEATVAAVNQEVNAAKLADQEGLPMTVTRALLCEAMQRRIFAELLPTVNGCTELPAWPDEDRKPAAALSSSDAVDLDSRIRSHRVGAETLGDLQSKRRTQIGMRLAMVGYQALRPEGRGLRKRVTRFGMALVKPFYLFAAFAALNLARAMFLVTLTAVGFFVGPWRLRREYAHIGRGYEVLSYERRPFSEGWRWWDAPVRPSSMVAWLGAVVVLLLGAACVTLLVQNCRQRKRAMRRGTKVPDGRGWYILGVIAVALCVVPAASGVCLGPIGALAGSSTIGFFATRWMRRGFSWLMGLLTASAYAVVGLLMWLVAWWRGLQWFDGIRSGAVVGLYAGASVIAISCTYVRVLANGKEIGDAARRSLTDRPA